MTESSSKNLKIITLDTQTSSVFTTSYDPSTPLFFLPIICFLIILLVIVNILIYIYKKYYCLENKQKDSEDSIFDEVQFKESKKLKLKYFLAYILTRGSVWSKSPYLYTMYNKYHGFTIDEIGILYVIDAVTALISGPALGNLADKYGRKLFCINYCILVIANLSLRITGSKSLAYLAQVLTGLGAGLIMTTFESWVNYEANKIFKENSLYKEKFLKKLFKQQSLSDALTSLFITSITAVAFSKYGILFPIWLSMLLAGLALGVILLFWEENKPNEEINTTISHSIKEALQELKKREVLSIGIMESLYNAVVNIFIFSWTPLLEKSTDVKNMQVGFVFLCFVTSVIIGTSIFEFFIITLKSKFYISMSAVLFIDMLLFMNVYVNDNFTVRLISLACIEGITGFYLPLNSIVKSKILVEKHRTTLMNIFRIPLNVYVIFVLLSLKYMDPFTICLIAFSMLTVSFSLGLSLYLCPPIKIQEKMRKYSEMDYKLLETMEK